MVSKLLGITLGISLANAIGSSTSLALAAFAAVTAVHMYCNLKSYQSIQLRTLNPYRASELHLPHRVDFCMQVFSSLTPNRSGFQRVFTERPSPRDKGGQRRGAAVHRHPRRHKTREKRGFLLPFVCFSAASPDSTFILWARRASPRCSPPRPRMPLCRSSGGCNSGPGSASSSSAGRRRLPCSISSETSPTCSWRPGGGST